MKVKVKDLSKHIGRPESTLYEMRKRFPKQFELMELGYAYLQKKQVNLKEFTDKELLDLEQKILEERFDRL